MKLQAKHLKKLMVIAAFLPFFCKAQTTNHIDSCGESFYVPVNTTQMKLIYSSAKANSDGYSLVRLAKIENENQFLTDILAGDILYDAYRIGVLNQDPSLLYNIATYENTTNLIDLKAGDILAEAYRVAMFKKNAFVLFKVATYENVATIMNIKAGDILYEAFRMALANKDVSALYKIYHYEKENDLMKITSEEIATEISKIRF